MFRWVRLNDTRPLQRIFFFPFLSGDIKTSTSPRPHERNRNDCDLDGLISPLQKGSYSECFLRWKNCERLLHYLPSAPLPCRTLLRQSSPLQENGFFCSGSSDKDDRRKGYGKEREWIQTEKGTHPPNQAQNQFIFLTLACRLSPPLPPPLA